ADKVSPRLTVCVFAFTGCGFGLAAAAAGGTCTAPAPAPAVASPVLVIGPIRTSADWTLLATSCSASCRRWPRVQWRLYSAAMRVVALRTVPAGIGLSASQRGLRLRRARM